MKNKFGWVLTILSIIIFGVYFFYNQEIFSPLLEINHYYLILLILLRLLVILKGGLFTKIVLEHYKKTISLTESFFLSALSSAGNFFGPFLGGLSIRAIYLKKKHGFPYSYYLSLVSGNYIIVFLVYSIVVLIVLGYAYFFLDLFSWILTISFLLLLIANLIVIRTDMNLDRLQNNFNIGFLNRIINIFNKIIVGWGEIVQNKKLLNKLIFITILGFINSCFTTFLLFNSIDVEINFVGVILYSSLSGISMFLTITPGAIGIREAMLLFSSSIIGISNEQILQTSVIDRAVTFIVLFIIVIFNKKMIPNESK